MSSELTERQAFLVLNALPNIGPITLNRLLEELGGDPRKIFSADPRRLENVKGVGPVIRATLAGWRDHFDLAREEERMARSGADFITAADEGYPKLLREISDPPIGLYRKGRYSFDRPCIAIVGSRRTTLYGQATAKKLGAELASLGFCVVSGLARGIDTAAHEGALSVGGKTAGVVGCGIDIIYPPENLELYRRIEASGVYVNLHVGPRSHLYRSSLAHLLQRLDPQRFVRVHRSVAVNTTRIRELQPRSHGDYTVVLKDGTELVMSRGFRPQFEHWLKQPL